MFTQSHPDSVNIPRQADEVVEVGNTFIIDWIGANPMKPTDRRPIVIAGNMTEENLQALESGALRIETPRFGTKQRVLLKVVAVEDI